MTTFTANAVPAAREESRRGKGPRDNLVTPTRRLAYAHDGVEEILEPGQSIVVDDHPIVRRNPGAWQPIADGLHASTRAKAREQAALMREASDLMDERERITGECIDAPTRTRTRLYGTPENPIRSGGGPSRTTTHPLLAGKSRAQREREEADAFWARHDDHVLGPLRCRSEQDAAYMDAVEQVCTVPVLDAIPTLAINPHK